MKFLQDSSYQNVYEPSHWLLFFKSEVFIEDNFSLLKNEDWTSLMALEKEMATHSSILAWRIPWTEETGRLQYMGLHRVRHNWSDLAGRKAWHSGQESTCQCRGHWSNPWSRNIPQTEESLSLCTTTTEPHSKSHEPQLLSLCVATTEAHTSRACALQKKKPTQWEDHAPQQRVVLLTATKENPCKTMKTHCSQKKKRKKKKKIVRILYFFIAPLQM